MDSTRSVLELLGYEFIKEVNDRILLKNLDGSYQLYINNKLVDAYKAYKDRPLFVLFDGHKYYKIGSDLTIQGEINMSGGWIIYDGQNRYIQPYSCESII